MSLSDVRFLKYNLCFYPTLTKLTFDLTKNVKGFYAYSWRENLSGDSVFMR